MEKRKGKKGKNLKTTYSLPSLHERSETPGALDRRALGITGDNRCPEPSFWLQSTLPVTGVLAVGRVVKNQTLTNTACNGRTCSYLSWNNVFLNRFSHPGTETDLGLTSQ